MPMPTRPARLILVSGLSGAGKTTLIARALEALPDLTYLRTYTTRPQRAGEEDSHEYVFLDDADYNKLRAASADWDHTDYGGFKYGADAAAAQHLLAAGQSLICAVAPDLAVVQAMAEMYATEPLTIWIKTPPDVAKSRIYQDEIRNARHDDFAEQIAMGTNFDFVFEPSGDLEQDAVRFVQLAKDLVVQ